MVYFKIMNKQTVSTDFPIGAVDRQHNCLLIYLRTVSAVPISVCLHLCNDTAKCHILGCVDPQVGLMTTKFELG